MMYNMYDNILHGGNMMWGIAPFGAWGTFFILLLIWSLIWKGLALWKTARRGETVWFVIFLIVNTAGVLEILYLYVFSKKSKPVSKE